MTRIGFSCFTFPAPARSASNSGQFLSSGFSPAKSQPVSALVRKIPARSFLESSSGTARFCRSKPICRCATTNGAGRISKPKTRFVEILDGVILDKPLKERGAIHAIERGSSPVENFHQSERAKLIARGNLVKQRGNHRHMQRPRGGLPVEIVFALRLFLVPEN